MKELFLKISRDKVIVVPTIIGMFGTVAKRLSKEEVKNHSDNS